MSEQTINVPTGSLEADIIQLLLAYTGNTQRFPLQQASEVSLTAPNGDRTVGVNAVCWRICLDSAHTQILIGSNAEVKAQVLEWLAFINAEAPLNDAAVIKINNALLTRAFMCGNTLTLADIIVYAHVQRFLSNNFPVAEVLKSIALVRDYCNLFRWLDHCQHTVDTTPVFKRIHIPLPPFCPHLLVKAAPPAAPAKPAANGVTAKPAANAANAGKPSNSNAATKQDGAAAQPSSKQPPSAAPAAAAADASKDAKEGGGKKEKKQKKEQSMDAAAAAAGGEGGAKKSDDARIDALDIRVGRIVHVEKHPKADALYLEQIDVGEDKPRQVISGLLKFVPIEQMQNRLVAVVVNLKPAKLAGIESFGMVLCASNEEHTQVDPINPPPAAAIGEKIMFEGYDEVAKPNLNASKTKILEKLFPDLKTDANGVACYKGIPMMTSQGAVTASLANANVR